MRRITLTVIISLSMLLTTGYNSPSSSDEVIQAVPRGLEIIEFSKEDAFEHYVKLAPHSVQVYFYTKRYSKKFNVPEEIAFSVVKLETGYKGPDRYDYRPNQTSVSNAYGSYQVLLSTARYVVKIYPEDFPGWSSQDITPDVLLNNVELNTKLGIRYLRHLQDIYNNWIIACGFYNTGYPIVNDYARHAVRLYNLKRNV